MRHILQYDTELIMMQQAMKSLNEGVKRTVEIIKGLRLFSHLDQAEKMHADIHESLDSAIMFLNNKIKNKIVLVKEFGGVAPVLCYQGKLNQVFMNILSNAVDSILDKDIKSEHECICVKTETVNNFVTISISDTGKGIPEDIKNKIFDPFFTTKAVGKGTGLGLAISLSIINEHNGTINISNNLMGGSIFIISIPIQSESL